MIFKHPRLMYHSEDTFVGVHSGGEFGSVVSELTPQAKLALNGVSNAVFQSTEGFTRILFPSPMRIEGILPVKHQFWTGGTWTWPTTFDFNVRYSTDSLTGDDGTWTDAGDLTAKLFFVISGDVVGLSSNKILITNNPWISQGEFRNPWYGATDHSSTQRAQWRERDALKFRTQPNTDAEGGIIPIRLRYVKALEIEGVYSNLYLYGDSEPAYWQQGLQIREYDRTDPLRTEVALLGTAPKHSSEDVRLRVHNSSPDLTADNILVDIEPPDSLLGVPDYQFLFSLDGKSFRSSVEIGELSPKSTSPIIYMRRVTGSEHPEGPGQAIVRATAERWW